MNKIKKVFFLFPLLLLVHFFISKLQTSYYHSKRFEKGSEVFFVFSEDFTDEDMLDLVPSINDWNLYLNHQSSLLTFHDDVIFREPLEKGDIQSICQEQDYPVIIIEVYKFSEDDDLNILNTLNILGLTDTYGQVVGNCVFQKIWLNYFSIFPYNKTSVFTHEIGHAIGLSHVKNDFSVMSTFYNPSVVFPTQFDIQEFCKIYHCTNEEKKGLSFLHIPEKF